MPISAVIRGVFKKSQDVIKQGEIKEGADSQRIMYFELLRRMEELFELHATFNIVEGGLPIGWLEMFEAKGD